MEKRRGRRKKTNKDEIISKAPSSADATGELWSVIRLRIGLPLSFMSLILPHQSQGVGGGRVMREGINPQAFWLCVLSDKAAPEDQGRVIGEALQSKERRTNRHPKTLQEPEGI